MIPAVLSVQTQDVRPIAEPAFRAYGSFHKRLPLGAELALSRLAGGTVGPAMTTRSSITATPESAEIVQGRIRELIASGRLAALSVQNLEKLVAESGGAPYWWARLEKLRPNSEVPGRAVTVFLRELLAAPETVPWFSTAIKRRTMHGYPDWRTDDTSHRMHFSIAHDARLRGVSALASELQAWAGLPPYITLGSRTGPIRKHQPEWRPGPDGYVAEKETRGFYPRRRDVNAVPTWLNETYRAELQKVTTILKARYAGVKHTTAGETLRKLQAPGRGTKLYALDASAFDDTISLSLLRWAHSLLPSWVKHMREAAEVIDSMPLMMPGRASGEFELIERAGTMASGALYTSLTDSLVMLGTAMEAVAAATGQSIDSTLSAIESGRIALLNQGDDTLVSTAMPFSMEKLTERFSAFGLDVRDEGAPVFLQVVYDVARGTYTRQAARALMRSVARERAAPGPVTELMGMAYRWGPAQRDPDFRACWNVIADSPFLGGRSVADLVSLTNDVRMIEAAVQEAKSSGGAFKIADALPYDALLEPAFADAVATGNVPEGYKLWSETPPTVWRAILDDVYDRRPSYE